MTIKRKISALIILCMVLCQFSCVQAAEIVKNGVCGENATWTFYADGLLMIEGFGAIYDYPTPEEPDFYGGIMEKEGRQVKKIVISDGITAIGDYAFYGMLFMKDVTVPATVTRIGDGAFESCDLKNIVFPDGNSIKEIGNNAFYGHSMLKSVDLSNCLKLEKIGAKAFSYNKDMIDLALPQNGVLKEIGDEAFSKNSAMTSVEIPESVTTLGELVFSECKSLLRVKIPEAVTSCGSDIFKDCASLTVYGKEGSLAEQCAKDNNVRFVAGGFDKTVVAYEGTCGPNLSWTLDSAGTLRIFGTGDMDNFASISYTPWQARNSSVKNIVIEDGVTSIGKDAFSGMDALETVVMADSVKIINMGAFTGNKNLKTVKLSDNLTTIGENAFYSCSGLTEMFIPATVEIICDYTFFQPEGLRRFVVDEINPYFSSDERGVLFNKDKTVLIQYPIGNKETSYIIPKSVKKLAKRAFDEAVNLEEIKFEEGTTITEIENNAFQGCSALRSIELPDLVTDIKGNAFGMCSSLENIKFPSQLKRIWNSAFRHCPLKSIEFPESLEMITENAFYLADVEEIKIPDNVTTIGNQAFAHAENLKNVDIGKSVVTMGDDVFINCLKLEKITVSSENQVYSSDEYGVLFNKDKTVLIKYPAASKTKSYVIPETVTEISADAFNGADSLESVILPENLSVIGNFAFARTSIREIDIPRTVYNLGVAAFNGCKNLAKINIPVNSILTTIEKQAFSGTAITEFDVPASVTTIGYAAFSGCENLLSITVPYGSKLGYIAAYPATSSTTIYVPEGSAAEESAKKNGVKYSYVNEIKVFVDGQRVVFDQHPVIVNGRTMVPLRAIFEALDATVGWEHEKMTATGEKDGTVVSIEINSDVLMKNGENVTLDSPAILVNNRTMVPVRAISEAFGCEVEWKTETREVIIKTN